jgi:hypothetical protein
MIVGWLVGVFFGLRWLWRQAKALMEALATASEATAKALDGHMSSFEAAPIPEPAVFVSPGSVAGRVRARYRRIASRKARRRQRHQAAYDSWAVLAGYKDG